MLLSVQSNSDHILIEVGKGVPTLQNSFFTILFFICYWKNVINVFHGKSNLNLITFNQAEIIILNYGVWNKTHEASSVGEGDRRTPIVSFSFSSGYIKVTGYPKWAFVLDLLPGRCADDIRGFPHFVL